MSTTAPARRPEPKCPECEKLKAVSDQSQTVGEFIDWLQSEKGMTLAKRHTHTDSCYTNGFNKREFRQEYGGKVSDGPINRGRPVCQPHELREGRFGRPQCGMAEETLYVECVSTTDLLAEFFEIDMKKVERERQALLDYIRAKG